MSSGAAPAAAASGGPSSRRDSVDACPGVLRPFLAADGAIVRLRTPGGRMRVAELGSLVALAAAHGAPFLQLTTRANLQLRGLADPPPDALVRELGRLLPVPSAAHERARNIIADPFDEAAAVLARRLDAALCERPMLAALPGRFLFAIDSAAGSAIVHEGADIVVRPRAAATVVAVRAFDGGYRATQVGGSEAVDRALDLAERFLRMRPSSRFWRTADLPADSPYFDDLEPVAMTGPPPPAPGVRGDRLLVAVPLGFIDPATATALGRAAAAVGSDTLALTPWKSVVLQVRVSSGLDEARDVLTTAGLPTADSPAHLITACIGAPWCRRTDVQTVELARGLTDLARATDHPQLPLHLSGCERRCGAPSRDHIDAVPDSTATADTLLEEWRRHR